MQGRLRGFGFSAMLLALLAVGCQWGGPRTASQRMLGPRAPLELTGTRQHMRRAVEQRVPLGTRIEEARAEMRRHGFHCSETTIEGEPATVCIRREQGDAPVSYEYRVIFWEEDGHVAHVDVETYGYTPAGPEDGSTSTATAAGG